MKLEYVVNADGRTTYFQVWLTDKHENSAMLAESTVRDKALWRTAETELRKMADLAAKRGKPRL